MLNVMIVDDSLIIRKKLKTLLSEFDCTIVAEAKNGKEAVEYYDQYIPDMVTMDITMPIMNGIVATKEIISRYADANIVMITSHGQEDMVRKAIKSGAKGYILKPITSDKISKSINRLFSDLDDNLLDNE